MNNSVRITASDGVLVDRRGLELTTVSKPSEFDMRGEDYACPVCLGCVLLHDDQLKCSKCSLSFPVIDGIPVFAKRTASDCGKMACSELEDLGRHCHAYGWRNGVASFLAEKESGAGEFWARYFVPGARGAGRLLLPANRRGKVLDVGCGLGPLSMNFAQYMDEVTAMDCGLAQLQLLRIRAEEAGRHNLRLVCAGDRQRFPFRSASFDIVLLNGVLEWVATKLEGEPRQQQLRFLMEVHRVLKPDGAVYIGIENRFALDYLTGMADEHTDLRFVTLLPRRIANLLSQAKCGQPYRVYTYSRRGYRKLLRKAGFATSRLYVPWPNYRNIRRIEQGHRDLSPIGEVARRSLLKAAKLRSKAFVYPYLAHSFSIVAGKTQLRRSLLEEFVAKLEDWLATQSPGPRRLEPLDIRIGETSVALVSVGDKTDASSARFMLRIPLVPQAECRQRHNFQMLERLTSCLASSFIGQVVPRPIVHLECDGQSAFVHRLCHGFDLRQYYQSKDRAAVYRLGLNFLLKLSHAQVERRAHSVASLRAWLSKREAHLCATVPAVRQGGLHLLVESALASLEHEPPLSVWMHGDFWPGNLLSTAKCDQLTGVVDWEFAECEGMPLIDLLHLLLYTEALAVGRPFSQVLAERVFAGRFASDEKPFIKEYCEALDVSNRAMWALAFMAWLDWVYRRAGVHGYLPSWHEREVHSFLETVNTLPTEAG
jgi:ubiquinone/menaquinone biosynthesis C-methylase UbiE/aminoglycoside phosphotransferase (APT) family kinase protein